MERKYINLSLIIVVLVATGLSCRLPGFSGDDYALGGIKAYEENDLELAINKFEKALDIGVEKYDLDNIYTLLGHSYNDLGSYDEAINAYDIALIENPENYKAWVGLGTAYRKKDQYDEARKCYYIALEIEPNYAEAHSSIGVLQLVEGDLESAIESFELAVELSPWLAVAHGNLALGYALDGRFDDAEQALQQAIGLGYDNWRVIDSRIKELKE